MASRHFQNDTDYESDDERPTVLTAISGLLSRPRPPSQRSYDILARNCGGSASQYESYAKIRRLKKACRTYEGVELYVKNSAGSLKFNIQNIYKISRKSERAPFDSKIYRMLLWHGTNPSAVPGIIQTGFRMGSGGLYGGGIYFADRIAKSAGYCQKNASGVGYFFIAEIDLGKVYKAHHTHSDYSKPPPGFDSVKGNGSQIPTWRQNRTYHGAVLPCGVTCQNKRHSQFDLAWNEYIVYDPNRIVRLRSKPYCSFSG